MTVLWHGLAGVAAASLLVVPAAASPVYPGELQRAFDLPCAPECMLCHRTPEGGYATVSQLFGRELIQRGLVAREPDLLLTLVGELEDEGSDVDSDGTPDLVELRAMTNPSDPDSAATLECAPEEEDEDSEGCQCATPRRGPGSAAAVCFASAITALAAGRRRARR